MCYNDLLVIAIVNSIKKIAVSCQRTALIIWAILLKVTGSEIFFQLMR